MNTPIKLLVSAALVALACLVAVLIGLGYFTNARTTGDAFMFAPGLLGILLIAAAGGYAAADVWAAPRQHLSSSIPDRSSLPR